MKGSIETNTRTKYLQTLVSNLVSPNLPLSSVSRVSRSILPLFAVLCFVVLPITVQAQCGVAWNKPTTHFEGVDDFGFVFLVEEAGKLDLGETGQIPIFIMFNSDWERVSPYLGRGWELPLLETRMVQTDEKNFKLFQPGGQYRMFWRSKESPTILEGQGGWKAEIKGDIITTYAPCGTKITLVKGRIKEMQIKDKRLEYVWNGDRVEEIREGGRSVLKVETDSSTGAINGVALADGKRIGITLGQRPRVEVVQGTKLVGGMSESLVKLEGMNGEVKSYKYAVDDDMDPTVEVNDGRLIVWDATSGLVLKDGEWINIKHNRNNNLTQAGLQRTNLRGENELWAKDKQSGKELYRSSNGLKVESERFVAGDLMGKKRSQSVSSPSGNKYKISYSYDEIGAIIKTQEIFVKYDSKQEQLETITKVETFLKNGLATDIKIEKNGESTILKINNLDNSISINKIGINFNN